MAFNPFSGSSGRLKSIAVTPDLTVPTPVLTGLTTAAVAGIVGFDVDTKVEDGGGIVHYESPSLATGPVAMEQLQGGIFSWSAKIAGMYDGDTTKTHAKFADGGFVVADLIYSRADTLGLYGCAGKIKNYAEKFDIKANAVTFTCTLEGTGLLPAATRP